MRKHRWRWRIALISPAVVVAGLAAAGLAGAGPALASGASSTPSPCPSQGLLGGVTGAVCQTVSSLPSPGAILPSPVSSVVGSVGSAVGSAVGTVTGALGASGSGGTSAGGTGTGSTGSAGSSGSASGSRSHAKSGGGHHARGPAASALGAAGVGSPDLGVLSSLGVPGWLVRGGLGPLPSTTVPLSFPVVHPGASKALAQAAVKPAPRAVSSLWLVFAIGVACLIGVAGGLGRFENRRRGVRRTQG